MIARRLAAALLGAAFALGACSDDPAKPGTVGSLTPTPTSSLTPGPTSSAALAAEAEAAVRAYYAATSHGNATGDVSGLRRLIAPQCPCKQVPDGIESAFKQGHIEGGQYTLGATRVAELTGNAATIEIDYSLTEIRLYDRAGTLQERIPALPEGRASVSMERGPLGWQVVRILRLGS